MDISRDEQRVLHALAQGGRIVATKSPAGKILGLQFYNRDGWLMTPPAARIFARLKAKRALASRDGGPYRITRIGLLLVRSQTDNR